MFSTVKSKTGVSNSNLSEVHISKKNAQQPAAYWKKAFACHNLQEGPPFKLNFVQFIIPFSVLNLAGRVFETPGLRGWISPTFYVQHGMEQEWAK